MLKDNHYKLVMPVSKEMIDVNETLLEKVTAVDTWTYGKNRDFLN